MKSHATPAKTKQTKTKIAGAVGYVRVSTEEQSLSGLGLEAQRAAIETECKRRAVPLLHVFTDAGLSAKDLHRPALQEAIARLDQGYGEILVAAKLDRLSRSVRDVVAVLDHSAKHGWRVLTLDLAIDTTTPFGEAMVAVSAAFAQLERRLIGERTRAALAVTKAQGTRLGRESLIEPDLERRIVAEHKQGEGWSEIARMLNSEGVPTTYGGRQWYPSTVRGVVLRARQLESHADNSVHTA